MPLPGEIDFLGAAAAGALASTDGGAGTPSMEAGRLPDGAWASAEGGCPSIEAGREPGDSAGGWTSAEAAFVAHGASFATSDGNIRRWPSGWLTPPPSDVADVF